MRIMKILCTLWLVCSVLLIISSIFVLLVNEWQKHHDKENANFSKKYTQYYLSTLSVGICAFFASGGFLLLGIF